MPTGDILLINKQESGDIVLCQTDVSYFCLCILAPFLNLSVYNSHFNLGKTLIGSFCAFNINLYPH